MGGQTGNKGDIGEAGREGVCSCAVSDEKFNEMSEMMQTIRQEMDEMNVITKDLKEKRSCESDGNLYLGDKCYFLSDTKTQTFAQAKLQCGSTRSGSQLGSIASEQHYYALLDFIQSKKGSGAWYAWTSGRYNPSVGENSVSWRDGTSSTIDWKWWPDYPTTNSNYIYFYLTYRGVINFRENWANAYSLCSY